MRDKHTQRGVESVGSFLSSLIPVCCSHMDSTLTTSNGAPVGDNDNSLTVGAQAGPILLQDFTLIDKLASFDREVIPERRVHAKVRTFFYPPSHFTCFSSPRICHFPTLTMLTSPFPTADPSHPHLGCWRCVTQLIPLKSPFLCTHRASHCVYGHGWYQRSVQPCDDVSLTVFPPFLAHGYFEVTADVSQYCKAGFLNTIGKKTPVFVRFSTVAGERGAADQARDPRGFAYVPSHLRYCVSRTRDFLLTHLSSETIVSSSIRKKETTTWLAITLPSSSSAIRSSSPTLFTARSASASSYSLDGIFQALD